MKAMEKYFLAIIPNQQLLEKIEQLKLDIHSEFGAKYALKSPPHITLKMPFSYNSAKEDLLFDKLQEFFTGSPAFELAVKGADSFGRRVIYLQIHAPQALYELQKSLKDFCKKELNLVDELSDRNYHPHLTVAFKDIKKDKFDSILTYVEKRSIEGEFLVEQVQLLRRENRQWLNHRILRF